MPSLHQQRLAVAAVFLLIGLGFGNLMSRLPEIQHLYQLSNAALGTVLFCRAAGALLAMPVTGWLGARFGSRRLVQVLGLGFAVYLGTLVLMPNAWVFAGLFFLFGVSEGVLDVSVNEQAVLVERGLGRPVMSSFHAVFSAGMTLGAATGALMAHWAVPLSTHFVGAGLGGACLMLAAVPYLAPAQPHPRPADQPMFLLPTKALLPLGLIAFCCMTGEGAMAEWSAVFLQQELQQTEGFAALALATFNAAMLVGRSLGDRFTARLGSRRLLLLDATAATLGLALVVLVPSVWVALAGFFVVGLGLSTIVPTVYSAAGNAPGVSPSTGIAMATSVGYAGFFVGPPVIGWLAEAFNLRVGLAFTLALFVLMWGLVRRLR